LQKTICEYNKYKKYTNLLTNCQHFVDEMISNLGLKPNYPKSIKRYFDGLQTDPVKNAKPHYFDQNGQKIFFHSHKELDDYVKKSHKFDDDMNDLGYEFGEDELKLFKAFDRGFWLKWASDENNKEFEPDQCPFGGATGFDLNKFRDTSQVDPMDLDNEFDAE